MNKQNLIAKIFSIGLGVSTIFGCNTIPSRINSDSVPYYSAGNSEEYYESLDLFDLMKEAVIIARGKDGKMSPRERGRFMVDLGITNLPPRIRETLLFTGDGKFYYPQTEYFGDAICVGQVTHDDVLDYLHTH